MEPEILVNISFRLPQADRTTLADHLAPILREAVVVGGDKVNVSIQPYDPDRTD